jgi:VIT1/CCC1 family predicted Fe2+/Mn2+ transporter
MTTDDLDLSNLEAGPHDDEPHEGGLKNRLNWLRAGVLGANDGIVSTAGIVMGVAGLAAGALSMAAGEYVSVSTQKDSELALLEKERGELRDEPEEELEELAGLYVEKGLSEELAFQVARELTEHDALGAHAEAELGIDPDDISSPWNAAIASMISFTIGALLPLLTITLVSRDFRIWVTVGSVALALALTGWASARFGYGDARRAVLRNVAGGLFAMAVTYAIGSALGTHV